MRILFDQGTPAPLQHLLAEHHVSTAFEVGMVTARRRELLAAVESEFDLLITADRQLRHQQNLSGRRLAILVLSPTSWRRIQSHGDEIVRAVEHRLCLPPARRWSWRSLEIQAVSITPACKSQASIGESS